VRTVLFCGLVSFAALWASGCPDETATDAGGADSGDPADAGLAVTPPDIPWLAEGVPPIALTPCPEGWREVSDSDVATCDPYPAAGPSECTVGEAHFPGEPGCRAIGDPCPASDYAAGLDAASVIIYVDPAASPGGDGSRSAPFASLAEVPWSTLTSGTTVALAKGTHTGVVLPNPGVSVVGACVGETVLTGDPAPWAGNVTVRGVGEPALVRNIAIRDVPSDGARVFAEQKLRLEGVLVERAAAFGVSALAEDAELVLEDVVVRDVEASDTLEGLGIYAAYGARIEAARVVVEGMRGIGVYGFDAGTTLRLEDVAVIDPRLPLDEGYGGAGISAAYGARVEGARVVVRDGYDRGLNVAYEGSEMALTDVLVTRTRFRDGGLDGALGVSVSWGARIELTRALISDSDGSGLVMFGDPPEAVLVDTIIRGTTEVEMMRYGSAIGISAGRMEATRLLVEDSDRHAIFCSVAGTEAILTDALLRGGGARLSFGVYAHDGARLRASRLLVSDRAGVGLFASFGAELLLEDTVVQDTRAEGTPPIFGTGIQALFDARIEGSRLRVESSHEVGVLSFSGSEVELRDTSILTVAARACAAGACPQGYGAAAHSGSLRLTRFEVRDAETCGLMVAEAPSVEGVPSLDVASGVVSGSTIGACVQVDGYDLSRLTTDVEYSDNGVNLDTTMLPLPEVPTVDPVGP